MGNLQDARAYHSEAVNIDPNNFTAYTGSRACGNIDQRTVISSEPLHDHTPNPELTPILDPEVQQIISEQDKDERKRRWLLMLLLLLLLLIACVGYITYYRYQPSPSPCRRCCRAVISENIVLSPGLHIFHPRCNRPIGVAVSPDGQRIYVSESDGERMIKMFDRDGNLILSFAPPGTNAVQPRSILYCCGCHRAGLCQRSIQPCDRYI